MPLKSNTKKNKNKMRLLVFICLNFLVGIFYTRDSLKKNSVAYCISGFSKEHKNYFAQGGLGLIFGDGKLNYSNEHLLETYYSASLVNNKVTASLFYQFIANPAYNKDRGPIDVYSIRMPFTI